ncbi:MAG: RNA polymerase sigma factor [Phycisphaeraceae bacterium]|nr:RNA polymerase sigma factor [Phycisphaeraceae bacterium]
MFATEYQNAHRALWCIAAGVLGDRSGAADVVQDAAVTGLRKLHEFQPGTSFLAWMARIVRFTAINQRRKHQRHRTGGVDPSALDATPGHGPGVAFAPVVNSRGEIVAAETVFDDRMLGALHELTEQARACLLLRVVLEMPYRDIAVALDIPEGTAMSHVHRARRQMRASLAGSGPASADGQRPKGGSS